MTSYQIWECLICGFIYDESLGMPEDNIAPGTRWADIPDDWLCPDCGVGKQDFEMAEVEIRARGHSRRRFACHNSGRS